MTPNSTFNQRKTSCENISHRPLLCLEYDENIGVLAGGSDHSIHVASIDPTSLKWTNHTCLYGKDFGHSDWVTCVKALSPLLVLSAGMDGVVCLWRRSLINSKTFTAISAIKYQGPISKLVVLSGDAFYASSYDGTIVKYLVIGLKSIHPTDKKYSIPFTTSPVPIVDFITCSLGLVSADKVGRLTLFNNTSKSIDTTIQAHVGTIEKLYCIEKSSNSILLVTTGKQDGHLRVFNPLKQASQGRRIVNLKLYDQGINSSCLTKISNQDIVICCGGESGTVHFVNIQQKQIVTTVCQANNLMIHPAGFISYSIMSFDEKIVVGWGDGSVSILSMNETTQNSIERIDIGAKNALRAIVYISSESSDSILLVGCGDDGNLFAFRT